MTRLTMSRLFGRLKSAPAVQPPPAGALPLSLTTPDLSALAAPAARSGRGAFRLDGVAASALAGDAAAAIRGLQSAVAQYDGAMPAHDVRDSARRAFNLALTAAVLGDALPAGLRDEVATAVAHHLAKVEGALPWNAPPALADALLSWTGAALLWPTLPASRHVWSAGLTALEEHGAERVHADGAPRDCDPLEALAWVEAGLLTARAAAQEGVALPEAVCGAVGAAAWHLYVRGTPDGLLAGGDVLPVSAHTAALVHAARDATLARSWSAGSPAAEHNGAALLALFGVPSPGEAQPLTTSADWVLYAFRDGPTLVMHGKPRTLASRVVVDGSSWPVPTPELIVEGRRCVGHDASTLSGATGTPELDRARIDPRQARGVYLMGEVKRDITVRQGRVLVLDTPAAAGSVSASWEIAEGWTVHLDGNTLTGEHPDATKPVRITLDARLSWTVTGHRADGVGSWDGDIYEPLRTSIEWT